MARINKKKIVDGDVTFEFDVTYSENARVEEGHGFHTFYDVDILSIKLVGAFITIYDDAVIDIFSRLKKDEIKLIESAYEDADFS